MKKFLLFVVAVVPFACSDDDGPAQKSIEYDYVVFGDFYGECAGNCVHLYKLESGKLYADRNREYPSMAAMPRITDYVQLSNELYNEVKDLPNRIPYATLKAGQSTVGEPDGGDWGGIYLEVRTDDGITRWFLDKKRDNLPDNLKGFVTDLNEKITLVKDSD